MITEDYTSFEVAKLLKEKGFDIECNTAYYNGSLIDYTMYGFCIDGEFIFAPTHQMAMKWLREVHLLFIDIDPLTCNKWSWSIWFMNDPKQKVGESPQTISTYEEACEAAIKYCLELLYDYRRLR